MSPRDPPRSSSNAHANRPTIERLPPHAANPSDPSSDYQTCLEIRRVVFIDGQSVPAELEFDGLDPDAIHFLAFGDTYGERRALGTARMRIVDDVAKAERIAVLEESRGLGIGRALVESIEVVARQQGLRSIDLNAQVQAAGFYEKLGFVAGGDVFVEAGIDHRQMAKPLV